VKLILVVLSTAFYGLMAIRLFRIWWVFFKQDTDLAPGWAYFSIAVLVLASVFWPVVVPFAYLELLGKVQRNAAGLEAKVPEAQTREAEIPGAEAENPEAKVVEPGEFVSSVEL
jgi:uncharacterized membrane protein